MSTREPFWRDSRAKMAQSYERTDRRTSGKGWYGQSGQPVGDRCLQYVEGPTDRNLDVSAISQVQLVVLCMKEDNKKYQRKAQQIESAEIRSANGASFLSHGQISFSPSYRFLLEWLEPGGNGARGFSANVFRDHSALSEEYGYRCVTKPPLIALKKRQTG